MPTKRAGDNFSESTPDHDSNNGNAISFARVEPYLFRNHSAADSEDSEDHNN